MFHFLQNLHSSVSHPRRRRVRHIMLVPCEAFETRLVLSAVTGLESLEQLPTLADDVDSVVDQSQTSPDSTTDPTDATQRPVSPTPALFDFATPGFGAPLSDGTPQEGGLLPQGPASFAIDGGLSERPETGFLPPDMLDSIFGDVDEVRRFRGPGGPHRHRPLSADSTGGDSTEVVFEHSAASSRQMIVVDAEPDLSTVAADVTANNDDAEDGTAGIDGFVEIPRSTHTRSKIHSLLQDNLKTEDAATGSDVQTRQLDLRREQQQPATDEDDSAVQAALEFFNRQTAGGFVDAGLDELQAAAGLAGATGVPGLEAGLGRFNPFDDRSHATMLTAVELRHVAEADTTRDGDHSVSAEAALAGIVLGTVGLRHRSLDRLLKTFPRVLTRLASVFLSDR